MIAHAPPIPWWWARRYRPREGLGEGHEGGGGHQGGDGRQRGAAGDAQDAGHTELPGASVGGWPLTHCR